MTISTLPPIKKIIETEKKSKGKRNEFFNSKNTQNHNKSKPDKRTREILNCKQPMICSSFINPKDRIPRIIDVNNKNELGLVISFPFISSKQEREKKRWEDEPLDIAADDDRGRELAGRGEAERELNLKEAKKTTVKGQVRLRDSV